MSASHHPAPALLAGYRLRLLEPDELIEVDRHLAFCAECREELGRAIDVDGMARDAYGALRVARRTIFQRVVPYAIAASVLLAGALSIRFASRESARGGSSPEPDAVREALRAGRVPLPAFLEELEPKREVLMGAAQSPRARLLSPAATAVLERAPLLSWEPTGPDARYEVRVFTLAGAEAARSPSLSEPRWTCDHALEPGDYEWQVTASKGDERVTLPEPPATPPRFRVLGGAAAERLRLMAAQHPGEHLRLGVEYARVGAVQAARRELEAALRESPSRDDVRTLLASLPKSG